MTTKVDCCRDDRPFASAVRSVVSDRGGFKPYVYISTLSRLYATGLSLSPLAKRHHRILIPSRSATSAKRRILQVLPIARDWPCGCNCALFNLVKQQSVTGRLQGRNPFDRPISVHLDESPTGRMRKHRLPSPAGGRQLYRTASVRSFAGLPFIDFELGSRSVDAHFSISAHCVDDEGWGTTWPAERHNPDERWLHMGRNVGRVNAVRWCTSDPLGTAL